MKEYFTDSIVIDANIFVKLLHKEHDSEQAFNLLCYCIENDFSIIAPTLFDCEVISVCIKVGIDLNVVLSLLDKYKSSHLFLEEPTLSDWQLASKICQDGNDKSGYPSMYDSIYQAMAINKGISFITADNRHYQKAQKHGNIGLLEHWQTLFKK